MITRGEGNRGVDWGAWERARLARDRRYDGLFFTAVRTTGIYCRPICPVHPAHSKNVVFFRTAVEAEQAGFRPCLRCRPETAPGCPAWRGTEATGNPGIRPFADCFPDGGTGSPIAGPPAAVAPRLSPPFHP